MGGGRRHLAEILLIGVTAVWGATFVVVKEAVALYPTLPFLALRFGMATLLILPFGVAGFRQSRRQQTAAELLGAGVVMGLLLTAGYVFQTFGLEYTTASNAGFITGLFVVLVPTFEFLLFRRWVGWWTAGSVAVAFAGLFLLSGTGSEVSLLGDGLVFLCAVGFALHILATSRFASRHDPIALTTVQLGTVAVASLLMTAVAWSGGRLEDFALLPRERSVWEALVITAVLASVAGYLIQTYAQRHAPPARTALILTMEPVFAGLFGYLLAGEMLTPLGWVGAGMILTAMLAAELRPGRRRRWVSAEEGLARVDTGETESPVVIVEGAAEDAGGALHASSGAE